MNVIRVKKNIIWFLSTIIILVSYIVLLKSGNSSFSVMFHNVFVVRSRVQVLAILVLVLLFVLLLSVTKSYWGTVALYLNIVLIISVVNYEKYSLRKEGVLPSDLLMLKSMGKILEMVNPVILFGSVLIVIVLSVASYFMFRSVKVNMPVMARCVGVVVPIFCFWGLFNIQNQGTIAYKVGQIFGDNPIYYDSAEAVESNGPIINFVNNLNVTSMDKPINYSKKTMDKVVTKYTKYAKKLNKHRDANNTTVIFILSESFSDPTNVPGVKLNSDPIPYTRELMKNTNSGSMISDGYGGGTANMEYQALTGLSMGNFSATLPTPYTQLVPSQRKVFSINTLFDHSYAIHPYSGTLYSREEVFKKMKFNDFYYLNHGIPNNYTKKISKNPYVSDKSTYKFLLDKLKTSPKNSFYQISTMQNHMPYNKDYYKNNDFKVTSHLSKNEKSQVETYAQGLKYTDEANQYLLERLSKLKQNVSVVFYGDHLPGIYDHLNFQKYSVQAHETPYFIWSNHKQLNKENNQVMGTYGFASALFDDEKTKITPYFALLHKVNSELPVIASKVSSKTSDPNLPNGSMNLIDKKKLNLITDDKLSKTQKKLLREYQLVQYDFTAGKYYAFNKLLELP
ncbi:hypothetical protein FBR6_0501 [Lactiplantibacillus plantarum]|nr:hypothetical protein AYO51_06235 [Lactiplantibacillus plantarum]KYM69361.1 hypothetical protein AZJ01_12050 [Lactiplantibacillus plantarum]KZE02522.1 hypothetical protein FBR6_0501 [Lactiplantibacillus plantarum]MCG0679904.1 hypothetical protein [Lactiplantibacillus plantarum]